jgi:type VI secretion system ImpM family protein
MNRPSLPIACHGKIPSEREYVHHQVGPLDVEPLDRWIRESHRRAFAGGRGPVDGYDASPPVGFVFSVTPETALEGVLQASRDSTDRRYPFWVAWPAGGPSLRAPLFRAAESFLRDATQGTILPRSLGAYMADLQAAARREPAAAPAPTVTLDALLQPDLPLRTDADPTRLLGLWMQTFAGRPASMLRRLEYGVQLPLNTATNVLGIVDFWMHATRRLARSPDLPLSLFWTFDRPDSTERPGFLLLFSTPPPPGLYAHLFDPETDRPFVYALDRVAAHHAADALATLPTPYRALLDPDRSAADLLAALP